MSGKDRSVDVHGMKRGLAAVVVIGVAVLMAGLQGQVPGGGSGYSAADWPFVGGNWDQPDLVGFSRFAGQAKRFLGYFAFQSEVLEELLP